MISTKGRYALRIMIDLAEHRNGGFIPMKEVAARQEISLKYIERIMPVLTKNSLVKGLHGKGGGYRLTREPDEYTVLEVLQAAEETLPRFPAWDRMPSLALEPGSVAPCLCGKSITIPSEASLKAEQLRI